MNLQDLLGQIPPPQDSGPRDEKRDELYKKLAVSYNNAKDYLECLEHLGPTQNVELIEGACAALQVEAGNLLENYKALHAHKVATEAKGTPPKV